jgi:hypothetical protein
MTSQPFTGFIRTKRIDPALIMETRRCPKCGSAMFVKEACCAWPKAGWRRVLRCIKSGCSYAEGYERIGEGEEK